MKQEIGASAAGERGEPPLEAQTNASSRYINLSPDGERRPARNVGLRSLFVSALSFAPITLEAGDAETDTV
jgi:hypothetical protein